MTTLYCPFCNREYTSDEYETARVLVWNHVRDKHRKLIRTVDH